MNYICSDLSNAIRRNFTFKNKLLSLSIFYLWTILCPTLKADELILTSQEAKNQNFHIVKFTIQAHTFAKYNQNVPWPFSATYPLGFIGNSFNQYQPYNIPGYHLGSDIIQSPNSEVFAPVSGTVDAGYYGYVLNNDGTRKKVWKNWQEGGDPKYFEVAVIDDFGNRFEFHHIDFESLSSDLIKILNSPSKKIPSGIYLGRVHKWPTPFHYDHIHVNFVSADGSLLNPESIFSAIPDHEKPEVEAYSEDENHKLHKLLENTKLSSPPIAFVIYGFDKKDQTVFQQSPALIQFIQEGKVTAEIDMRESVIDKQGEIIPLPSVYPKFVKLPSGEILGQPTDFYPIKKTKFLMRIQVAEFRKSGPFELIIADIAGNKTNFKGEF